MYVRWQSRKLQGQKYEGLLDRDAVDVNWKAILVESARVDGTPTQRHIAYLGSITESGIKIPAQRGWFWKAALERLDQLNNKVSPEERLRIIAAVAQKVEGPPTKEQYEQFDRERQAAHQEAWAIINSTSAALMAPPTEVRCSFCGKPPSVVDVMLKSSAVGAVAICNECVDLCVDTIRKRQATPSQ